MGRYGKRYYKPNVIDVAFIALIMVVAVVVLLTRAHKQENDECADSSVFNPSNSHEPTGDTLFDANELVAVFAKEHNLGLDAWPEKLIELLKNNPDTKDFVLNYPLKKDLRPPIDLSKHINSNSVPLFFQWDERWGYTKYGNEIMGLSGCGPTCLSMVCIYLLGDAKYTPRYVADYAQNNGYYVPGSGSAWSLISVGGKELGLDVTEIPLDEKRIIRNLEVGNPIICVMGPGDFTTTGHFVVMTGYTDGMIKVNDPNSPTRSGMLWDFDNIKGQIRNLWVCR